MVLNILVELLSLIQSPNLLKQETGRKSAVLSRMDPHRQDLVDDGPKVAHVGRNHAQLQHKQPAGLQGGNLQVQHLVRWAGASQGSCFRRLGLLHNLLHEGDQPRALPAHSFASVDSHSGTPASPQDCMLDNEARTL